MRRTYGREAGSEKDRQHRREEIDSSAAKPSNTNRKHTHTHTVTVRWDIFISFSTRSPSIHRPARAYDLSMMDSVYPSGLICLGKGEKNNVCVGARVCCQSTIK